MKCMSSWFQFIFREAFFSFYDCLLLLSDDVECRMLRMCDDTSFLALVLTVQIKYETSIFEFVRHKKNPLENLKFRRRRGRKREG